MIVCCQKQLVLSLPALTETTPNYSESLDQIIEQNNKTAEKTLLPERQTESIKRVSAEHKDISSEYPPITNREPQQEIDKMSLEQLQIKCQQLSKLLSQSTTIRPPNHKYPDIQERPIYYPTRATFRPIRYPQTMKPQGFYVTAPTTTTTTKRPQISMSDQPTTPIKYIRLEPVILQKTILGDGRIVYLWHKSLPTTVEYPNNPTNYYPYQQSEDQKKLNNYSDQNKLGYSSRYGYYYDPSNQIYANNNYQKTSETTTTNGNVPQTTVSTTTTTGDPNSYGYGFRNFIPFYR